MSYTTEILKKYLTGNKLVKTLNRRIDVNFHMSLLMLLKSVSIADTS